MIENSDLSLDNQRWVSEGPLRVISGPSALYHPNGRF